MKKPSYIEDLGAFNFSRLEVPYAWGTNDCVVYSADALLAMTDIDYIASIRGLWSTEGEAEARLATYGGLIEAAEAFTQFERRVDKNYTQRGDLCLIRDLYGRPTLGICVGDEVAGPGPEGLVTVPMKFVKFVWRLE